ncbi:hypothetical protein TrLO_g2210 [Triparma laevis f. longispina]|uniref:Uncharacterized protein n=1 Tax=Triparma laevis f. longispina TaxID=1714387 RepID=A0A9W7DXF1_9STRA|nr:hypothetical protein TrLO_g2210 [Triparma laevis f. longispina]
MSDSKVSPLEGAPTRQPSSPSKVGSETQSILHEESGVVLSKALRAQRKDETTRRGLVEKYKQEQEYSEAELDAFLKYFSVFAMFDADNANLVADAIKRRKNIHELVSDVQTMYSPGENRLYIRGSIIVRGTALDILAFGIDYEAEHFKLEENIDPHCLEYRILGRKNDHSLDIYDVRGGLPPGFMP